MIKRYQKLAPFTKGVIFVVSLTATFAIFYLFFGSALSAGVLAGSILLHELGHLVYYRYYGYSGGIVFLPPLGAVMVPSNEKGLVELPDWQRAMVSFAGPGVNVVLAIAGLLLAAVFPGARSFGLMVAALNGSLAAFNLLPLFFTDGSKIIRALFESANEQYDRIIVRVVAVSMAMVTVSLILFGRATIMPVLFVWNTYRASSDDDPMGWQKPTAMTHAQVQMMTRAFVVISSLTIFVATVLRYWNSYK